MAADYNFVDRLSNRGRWHWRCTHPSGCQKMMSYGMGEMMLLMAIGWLLVIGAVAAFDLNSEFIRGLAAADT